MKHKGKRPANRTTTESKRPAQRTPDEARLDEICGEMILVEREVLRTTDPALRNLVGDGMMKPYSIADIEMLFRFLVWPREGDRLYRDSRYETPCRPPNPRADKWLEPVPLCDLFRDMMAEIAASKRATDCDEFGLPARLQTDPRIGLVADALAYTVVRLGTSLDYYVRPIDFVAWSTTKYTLSPIFKLLEESYIVAQRMGLLRGDATTEAGKAQQTIQGSARTPEAGLVPEPETRGEAALRHVDWWTVRIRFSDDDPDRASVKDGDEPWEHTGASEMGLADKRKLSGDTVALWDLLQRFAHAENRAITPSENERGAFKKSVQRLNKRLKLHFKASNNPIVSLAKMESRERGGRFKPGRGWVCRICFH